MLQQAAQAEKLQCLGAKCSWRKQTSDILLNIDTSLFLSLIVTEGEHYQASLQPSMMQPVMWVRQLSAMTESSL